MQLSSISLAMTRLGFVWTPEQLFAAGEQGLIWDIPDFSTLFQDAAGTTPVTAVGQPVGKILDKSGRGNHATQATSTKRPLLQQDATGRYYLAFDGVDDALATGSIDFTATDKMSVFAGVRKLSDAGTQIIAELSDGLGSGRFYLAGPIASGTFYQYQNTGSSGATLPTSVIAAPSTNVLTCTAAISTDLTNIRVNGAQNATSATDQGTGNYGNYPLYIGSRGGTSLPFNGRIYSLIIRGAQSTDAQIAAAEAYCNQRTGAY